MQITIHTLRRVAAGSPQRTDGIRRLARSLGVKGVSKLSRENLLVVTVAALQRDALRAFKAAAA